MEREELEQMAIWQRQVACSKLWDELKSSIYSLRNVQGRTPPDAKVRQTEWTDCWLYLDGEGYQVLDEEDLKSWVLVPLK